MHSQTLRKRRSCVYSLLWIDKARAKDKRYKEVSVWWKTKTKTKEFTRLPYTGLVLELFIHMKKGRKEKKEKERVEKKKFLRPLWNYSCTQREDCREMLVVWQAWLQGPWLLRRERGQNESSIRSPLWWWGVFHCRFWGAQVRRNCVFVGLDRAISELHPHQPQKKYLKYVCHRSMAEGTVMKLKQDLASANRERLELLVSRRSWS
jgi:hypothetical protein